MIYLAVKAAISGVLIAVASTLAKRYPGVRASIASRPLVSVLGMVWLWSGVGHRGAIVPAGRGGMATIQPPVLHPRDQAILAG